MPTILISRLTLPLTIGYEIGSKFREMFSKLLFNSLKKEYLMMATQEFTDPKAMDAYLNDFYVKVPINGYDQTIARKVNIRDFNS